MTFNRNACFKKLAFLFFAEAGLVIVACNALLAKNCDREHVEFCENKRSPTEIGLRCCGGRTRTCDLQVMSLASYQLLHSAILNSAFLEKRCKGTYFF